MLCRKIYFKPYKTMGLFDIFKKKEQPKAKQDNKILLAMPLFVNDDRYEINTIVDKLKNYWNLPVTNIEGNNDSAIITIDGVNVVIAYMGVPVPSGDIEGVAQYAYNWPSVLDDFKNSTGHAIVSVLSHSKPEVERFALLSKVLHAILSTSDSIGVYQGNQSLLIPKEQYIESAEDLTDDRIPIHLWVYLGLRKSEEGNSIYTYGMSEFDKYEMEVIDSALPLEELYDFISNICAYVISSNVTFKSGETLGYTDEQKINITLSKGKFVDGQSFKLEM